MDIILFVEIYLLQLYTFTIAMIFHDINNILFVSNDFPFTHIIFGLLPFLSCEKSPMQCGILNNVFMNILGLFTKRQSIQIP